MVDAVLRAEETSGMSPVREGLAAAIASVAEAMKEVGRLDEARARREIEAEAAQVEVDRLRGDYEARLTAWMDAGAARARPEPPDALLSAERQAAALRALMPPDVSVLPISDACYGAALAWLGERGAARDRAVWPAAVEAAQPVLRELADTARAALTLEMRLRSLIEALREAGRRHEGNDAVKGALHSAWLIEQDIARVRAGVAVARDPTPGRALIKRLRDDTMVALWLGPLSPDARRPIQPRRETHLIFACCIR